jgi:hypothetical protein
VEVHDLDTQFHDGVYLVLLLGLLEGFFIPFHSFYYRPMDFEQKVHNVGFAFELMQDVGLDKPKARPEGIRRFFTLVFSSFSSHSSTMLAIFIFIFQTSSTLI